MAFKEKITGIYKITSPTGKVYIGQSVDIAKRFWYYRSLNCKAQRKLYHSLQKHGVKNHVFEVLETCEVSNLDAMELLYINQYASFNTDNGLNLKEGGNGSRPSIETKLVQSELKKAFYRDNKEARDRLIAQLTSIDRTDDKNPKYGTGRRVAQFTLNKVFVCEYISVIQASKALGNISFNTSLYKCCSRRTTYGIFKDFIWRYSDDCIILDGVLKEDIIPKKTASKKLNTRKRTSVFRGVSKNRGFGWHARYYNRKTKVSMCLGSFNTETDAARAYNVCFRMIHGAIEPVHNIDNPFNATILQQKTIKTRGVKWNGRRQFESRIVFRGKEIYIGGFYSHKEAAIAYNQKAFELLGDKAKLNVVEA